MGLFSGRRTEADARPREYAAAGTPLVSADGRVVTADVVVRFTHRDRPHDVEVPDEIWQPAWAAEDERAIAVVVLTTMRLHAATLAGEDLLTDRAGLAASVDLALRTAPVVPLFEARTVAVELATQVGSVHSSDVFRVVG